MEQLIAFVIIIFIIVKALESGPILTVLVIGAIAYVIYYDAQRRKKALEKRKLDFENRAQGVISKHITALAVKWHQTIRQDAYGNIIADDWFREADYFIENVLMKEINIPYQENPLNALDLRKMISDSVIEYIERQAEAGGLQVDVEDLDPIQFEHYCANILAQNGWDVRTTPASGDQGIDVIANFGDTKIVIQCKKYSQPVGNAAVQEIHAGKAFEQADIAAVVSNASFTASATQLASAAGVLLLHYSELPLLAEKLGLIEAHEIRADNQPVST